MRDLRYFVTQMAKRFPDRMPGEIEIAIAAALAEMHPSKDRTRLHRLVVHKLQDDSES